MRPLHSAALGAGNQWIRHRSASKNGAMFQDAGRTRAFLIIRRNLVPFRERSDGMCDLSENPGALSGNPAVAGTPQPPKDLDFRTLQTSSFRIFAQTNEPAIRGAEECLQLQGDGRIRRKPAPWHGSCQTWPNQ
jgi:hypothetical protein